MLRVRVTPGSPMQNLSATLELRIAFCKEGGHSFPYVLARICNHDGERCIVERVFEGRIQSLAHHVFGEPSGKRCSFRDGPCKLERSTREFRRWNDFGHETQLQGLSRRVDLAQKSHFQSAV